MVVWYLEELGIPYEYIELDIAAGENKKPEYLAIDPLGKVPALVDRELILLESGAILLYLSERSERMPLKLPERAKIYEWVLFANSTLSNGLFLEDRRPKEMPILLGFLNNTLKNKQFLFGNKFTVADVSVGYYLYMAKLLFKLDWQEYPEVLRYLNTLSARTAFTKAMSYRSPTPNNR